MQQQSNRPCPFNRGSPPRPSFCQKFRYLRKLAFLIDSLIRGSNFSDWQLRCSQLKVILVMPLGNCNRLNGLVRRRLVNLIYNQVDKPSPNKTVQSVAIAKWHDKNYLQLAAAKLPIEEIRFATSLQTHLCICTPTCKRPAYSSANRHAKLHCCQPAQSHRLRVSAPLRLQLQVELLHGQAPAGHETAL